MTIIAYLDLLLIY